MALWYCGQCGTAYSVGAPCCPQCRSTDYTEDVVPKITVADGPSNALAELDVADEVVAVPDVAAVEDGPVLPDPPPVSAPKAEWVDHAVAVGVPPEDATQMTKPALVEAVKEVVAPDPQPAATPAPDSTPPPSLPASSAPADSK